MGKWWTAALVYVLLVLVVWVGQANKADANPYYSFIEEPTTYRIYSNGTCDIPNVFQQSNTYTLTSNVEGTIVIERDNVVLDGAGHTLQPNHGKSGIWMLDRNHIKITNLVIKGSSNAITFCHDKDNSGSSECTVENCILRDNEYGVNFQSTLNCIASGNTIENCTFGVHVSGSGNSFRGNRINDCKFSFVEEDQSIAIDASNTINGKPVYCWVGEHDRTVPDDAGLVILRYCNNIRVENLDLTNNGNGLSLYYTCNSVVSGNNISGNYLRGIGLWWSDNNIITYNKITNYRVDGIEENESNGNTIAHNIISGNRYGINHQTGVKGEVIASNQIINNSQGVCSRHLERTSNCNATDNYIFGNDFTALQIGSNAYVTGNNITLNKGRGIEIGSNSTVTHNFICQNQVGLFIEGSKNIVTSNEIRANRQGLFLELDPDNRIYSNNIIDNSGSAYVREYWVFAGDSLYDKTIGGLAQHIFGPCNQWDNGSAGNYWSDYNVSSQRAQNPVVGDTPYIIDIHNRDNYPLLEPLTFETLELPTAGPTLHENKLSTTEENTQLLFVVALAAAIIIAACVIVYIKSKRCKAAK